MTKNNVRFKGLFQDTDYVMFMNTVRGWTFVQITRMLNLIVICFITTISVKFNNDHMQKKKKVLLSQQNKNGPVYA